MRFIRPVLPILLGLAALVVLHPPIARGAQIYSGEMTYNVSSSFLSPEAAERMKSLLGPNWDKSKFEWAAYVDGFTWWIGLTNTAGSEGDAYSVGCDGTNTFSLNILRGVKEKREINDSIAVIEDGVMPCESDRFIHPIWLAFCAPNLVGKFFSNKQMPSLDLFGGDVSSETRTAKLRISYSVLSGNKFFNFFQQMSDEYDTGLPRIRLFVKQFEEFEEYGKFPKVATYERLRPGQSTNAAFEVIDSCRIELKYVTSTDAHVQDYLPIPTGRTDVKDRRFAGSSPAVFSIDYRLKEKSWPKKNDPFVVQRYEKLARMESVGSNKRTEVRRIMVVMLFVTVSGLFLIMFLLRKGGMQRGNAL